MIQLQYLHQMYYTPLHLFKMGRRDTPLCHKCLLRAPFCVWCGNAIEFAHCGPRLLNSLHILLISQIYAALW